MFFALNGQLVLLHGFIKKTQKTPSGELDVAQKRQVEVMAWKTTP
jgi:phage-related protein